MAAATKSAIDYANDAEILLSKQSNNHAFSLALLGYEELAKAIVALRMYVSNEGRVLKTRQSFDVALPSKLFGDHVFKLEQFSSYIKWFVGYQIKAFELLGVRKIKVNKKGLRRLISSYKLLAEQGHKLRMESTYINYDANSRRIIPKSSPSQTRLESIIRRLKAAADDFGQISKFYLDQARGFRQGNIPIVK